MSRTKNIINANTTPKGEHKTRKRSYTNNEGIPISEEYVCGRSRLRDWCEQRSEGGMG